MEKQILRPERKKIKGRQRKGKERGETILIKGNERKYKKSRKRREEKISKGMRDEVRK